MIPEEKSAAVERGLTQGFGVTQFEAVSMLTKGLSGALVLRIVIKGTPYLLRIITRTDAAADPTRQFACMKAGAEAGLAPRIWYTSIEDRISITDFVEAVPFPLDTARVRIPAALRVLHKLPLFPKPDEFNYFDALDGFIRRFVAANILPAGETAEPIAQYTSLAAAYPRNESDTVSCHNDLKPENVLFDGSRVWLVDWEAAFENDRYVDLSVVANFVVTSEADETTLLQAYFGHPPDEYQLARLFFMRQLLHMFYAAVFLLLGSGGPPLNLCEPVPEFGDFHRRIWDGEINLGDSRMKVVYGMVHWNRFLHNLQLARLSESLKIVSDRHTHR